MRLPPLPEEQWDERVRDVLRSLVPRSRRNPQGAGNAMATLVRHPDLVESFLPFSTRMLMDSTLPARLRELVILRVARRYDCAYEWAHHVLIAGKAGLSETEIEAAGRGESADALESAVYAVQDGNTLEATQTMLASQVVTHFPLCDQELLLRHLVKTARDHVKDYREALDTSTDLKEDGNAVAR